MGHTQPRIPPVPPEAFTDEQKQLVGEWSRMNFTRVIVNHPELYRVFLPLIKKLIPGSNLPPRDRQILVLRLLTLYDELYEVTHQVMISRYNAGMTDDEIEMARAGKGAGLSDFDRTLVRAAEELVRDRLISDATWRELSQRYSTVQLMEVVALVGGYTMLAMATKNYGMQLEDPETFNSFAEMRKYK
jgi:alkylhydroperoxidase family enzyme